MRTTSSFVIGWLAVDSCLFVNALPFNESHPSLDVRSPSLTRRSQQARESIISAGFEFIEPQSFFAIDSRCKSDTRSIDRNLWSNRFDYYKRAVIDATQIAKAAEKWPQFGTDASDLYMKPGLDSDINKNFADAIAKNIKAAANWEHPRWGFDPYIQLTCDDPHNVCNNKLAGDVRSVGCYVNQSEDLWGTVSQINCCSLFFTAKDNREAFSFAKSKNIDDVGMNWMRTSGQLLLHEMLHTRKITQTRPKIIDETFDGSGGKRIYGAIDCAKAAEREDKAVCIRNADSYAQFMSAMYWKDRFNGHLFKPKDTFLATDAPPGYVPDTEQYDFISDSQDNYEDLSVSAIQPKLTCAGEPQDKPSVKQPYVTSQIYEYCSHVVKNGYIVNSTTGRYGPRGAFAGDSAPESDNDIWLSLTHDPSCDENTGYEVDLSQCFEMFGMALNGCNTNSIDKKWGGEVQAYCTLWNITTRFGHSEIAPNGLPSEATYQERLMYI